MNSSDVYILGIESSCDDTAAAVLLNRRVLSNIISNQSIHEAYGGVVPELASRAHQKNIVPVINQAIKKSGINKNQLHAIAYTRGPGLLGSLMVGSSFAKSLALGFNIPLIEVHHMQAHILACFIEDNGETPSFPFLGVTISGGHTQIVMVKDYFDMIIIGETLDDAIGEAFDKSAKMLNLTYPGGPLVNKYAQNGNKNRFSFAKPKVDGLDFSFSGLKTSVLYFIQKQIAQNPNFIEENLCDLCASIQESIANILMDKIEKAVKVTKINQVVMGGGVSANSRIRTRLIQKSKIEGWSVHLPKIAYTTDNASMIGVVGYLKYINHMFSSQNKAPKAKYAL